MSNRTSTTNGASAFKSTGSNLVDLFFNIGAARNNPEGIKDTFETALAADTKMAAAILLWSRDVRHGGAGERNVFRTLFPILVKTNVTLAEKVLRQIPACGRFDDLTVAYGTPLESLAVALWVDALKNGNNLAFKWADRSDKMLQKALKMNEARLRKFISQGRKDTIVETAMCDGAWDKIAYGKLPSVAGMRYAKAFKKHDESRYTDFIKSKDTKVNASVAFPHDVYRMYAHGDQKDAASKYWAALPDLCAEGSILPICDVSGSMCCGASGKVTCMDVSVSLGVYLSQRIKGYFNGKLMTFSNSPTIVSLPKTDDIGKLFDFTANMDWGGSTNFEAAFKNLLAEAKKFKVRAEDMPKMLLVLSDMQFNQGVHNADETLLEAMKREYKASGYEMPKVCYWNLNGAYGNFPTVNSENGICMVSGFSPKVLESVLKSKSFTATDVMMEAVAPFVKMLDQ
jgi:hypothetical protein